MSDYDVKININDAFRYLGGHGKPDNESGTALHKAAKEIQKTIHPRFVMKICDIDRRNGLSLAGTCLELTGKAIDALLHDSRQCAIFCATLGAETDALIRQWQIRDLAFATMLDACGSTAVESLCDIIDDELNSDYAAKGLYITDRFSPGYGDLPLGLQRDFCSVLDTGRKIGVSVGEGGLMIPMKSITAISGIANSPQKSRVTGCNGCIKLKSCEFRERGVTCYGQTV